LRSFITENGQCIVYQEGSIVAMLSPEDLLSYRNAPFDNGSLMFCGTLVVYLSDKNRPTQCR